jgi:hypothetical protein
MEREFFIKGKIEPQLAPFSDSHTLENVKNTEDIKELPQEITPEVIINANQSTEVEENLRVYNENRRDPARGLVLEWGCIDARIIRPLPSESFYYNTIANGGNPEKIQQAVNSPVTKFALVVAHEPVCGGRIAKHQQIEKGISSDSEGLSRYISDEIGHPSVIQAAVKAKELAQLTSKLVVAMVHNHEDGTRKVLAVFNRTDGGYTSLIDDDILENTKPQNPLDDHLLPYLPLSELPIELQLYLDKYERARKALLDANPHAYIKMKNHNPRIGKIATDLRAAELWIPDLAQPGEIVRFTVPRRKIPRINGEKKTILNPKDIELIWEQAEYVMTHSVESRESNSGPFKDTDTFLISTPDFALSQEIALRVAQQPFAQPWLMDERNRILVIQNNAGVVRKVSQMRYSFKDGDVISFEEVSRAVV